MVILIYIHLSVCSVENIEVERGKVTISTENTKKCNKVTTREPTTNKQHTQPCMVETHQPLHRRSDSPSEKKFKLLCNNLLL